MKKILRELWLRIILPLMLGTFIGTSLVLSTALLSPITDNTPFIYSFNSAGTLPEAGSMTESWSPYWWVNSGGKLLLDGKVGSTILGELPSSDTWYKRYRSANPTDTDNGAHPQNIFRLISRTTAENTRIENWFLVAKDNLSKSPNRNASNGLLIMSRYKDGDTLYYAGVRVDGTAIIKKKYRGTYYTMAQESVFPGKYHRDTSPNLLPHDEWIGLRLHTATLDNGSVSLRLYMKREHDRSWKLIASAIDDGKKYAGTAPITGKANVGLRTDFMDVKFDSFRIDAL